MILVMHHMVVFLRKYFFFMTLILEHVYMEKLTASNEILGEVCENEAMLNLANVHVRYSTNKNRIVA